MRLTLPAGEAVARLLAGSWRPAASPIPTREVPALLARSAGRLLGAGCGPLAWRALAATGLRGHPAAVPYRDAYRYHAIRAAVELRGIASTVRAARDAGVEPLLVKGWATARLYPELGLRPFGDLDLCVRAGERDIVERALAAAAPAAARATAAPVDLHSSLDDLADRPLEQLLERAPLVSLGDPGATHVRVLDAADHLRLLALHLLRHGAWRPLWLCDVALIVESRAAAIDWDLCLRGSPEDARRVAYVIGLAHRLVGAALPHELPAEVAHRARHVPRWLVAATLAQWGRPYERYAGPPITATLRRPWQLFDAARRRWPNAIEASMSLDAPFGRLPRLPLQLVEVLRRTRYALAPPSAARRPPRPR